MVKLTLSDNHKIHGYDWIDPGIAYYYPQLNDNEQVYCLVYLLRHMDEIVSVPIGIDFTIFPGRFLYVGEPYPVIGTYTNESGKFSGDLILVSILISDQLEEHIRQVGIQHLLDEENPTPLTWQEVLSGKTVVCRLER